MFYSDDDFKQMNAISRNAKLENRVKTLEEIENRVKTLEEILKIVLPLIELNANSDELKARYDDFAKLRSLYERL